MIGKLFPRLAAKSARLLAAVAIALGALAGALPAGAARASTLAVTYYVDAGNPAPGDGDSWSTAYTSLTAALSAAVSGDSIWIADGTYKPSGSGRNCTFTLPNGVKIYGGFSGGEGSLGARLPTASPVYLSGDVGQPDISSDNCYHVITATNLTAETVLDRVSIVAGNADGSAPHDNGGGLRNLSSGANLKINAVTFSANHAAACGGGLYNFAAMPVISASLFDNNTSAVDGGGMCNDSNNQQAQIIIDRTRFTNNYALQTGGGLYFTGLHDVRPRDLPRLTNLIFAANTAEFEGGGAAFNLGDAEIINSVFYGNSVINPSGIFGGGGISIRGGSDVGVTNTIFWANTAGVNPQVNINGSAYRFKNNIVQDGLDPAYTEAVNVLSADPKFMAAPAWNFHLLPGSPAIDSGRDDMCASVDFAGVTRPQDGNGDGSVLCDIGIYEPYSINYAPTDIRLVPEWVAENSSGAVAGALDASDLNDEDTHTFTLVGGETANFEIVGSTLKLKSGVSFDYEDPANLDHSYTLTVRATDNGAPRLYFDKQLTVQVTNVNEIPTGISLSAITVAENYPGADIGSLSATDPDAGDSHTYSLVGGEMGNFEIVGNTLKLKATAALDYEDPANSDHNFALAIRATDAGGLYRQESFTISVTNVNDAPSNIILTKNTVPEKTSGAVVGLLAATDQDTGDTHTFELASGETDNFEIVGNTLKLKPGVELMLNDPANPDNRFDITIRATDSGVGSLAIEKAFVIEVTEAVWPIYLPVIMR